MYACVSCSEFPTIVFNWVRLDVCHTYMEKCSIVLHELLKLENKQESHTSQPRARQL